MEPESLLACTQEQAIGLYPQTNYYFFKIHFNIILPSTVSLPSVLMPSPVMRATCPLYFI
jgi:hypothetical protein